MNPESRERGGTGRRDQAERRETRGGEGRATTDGRGEPTQAQSTRKSGREDGEGTPDKITTSERERDGSRSAKATKRDRQGETERRRTQEAGGREGRAQPHARRKSPRTRREGIPFSELQGSMPETLRPRERCRGSPCGKREEGRVVAIPDDSLPPLRGLSKDLRVLEASPQ